MLIRNLIFAITLVAGIAPSMTVLAQPYGGGREEVECASHGHGYQRCDVPWSDARIVRQLSDAQCERGRSWGFDPHGFIWVDHGCSARFVATGGYAGPGPGGPGPSWQPDPGWDQRFSIRCESEDGRDHFCQVDVGGGGRVYLEHKLSNTRCVEGENWRWNRGGVWVTQGCRGVFTIDRRWR